MMANYPLTGFKLCKGHAGTEQHSHVTASETPEEPL